MTFLNPKTDFAFKKIFGSIQSKEILISFLNAMLYQDEAIIEDLEIINPYQPAQIATLKDTFFDVKAKLKNGTSVLVEMQVLNIKAFSQRILFNATKAYSTQLQLGAGYRTLKPVIALTITDFIMFPEHDLVISKFVFQEVKCNLNWNADHLQFFFVELPKFEKKLDELETIADRWLYFLKTARSLESIPDKMSEIPEIKQAFDIAERGDLTKEELETVEQREIYITDQEGIVMLAEERGMEKGKLQTATKMLKANFDDNSIAELTDLSLDEIAQLRSSRVN